MDILERFRERNLAELKQAEDSVKYWHDRIAAGSITFEHASGYLKIENDIIKLKRFILSLE